MIRKLKTDLVVVVSRRPDLVARIYDLKLKELLHDIKFNHIFGKVVGHLHVIEFQKRGLPHAHILTVLDEKDKLHTAELIDKAVSAEIPEPNIVDGVDLNENLRSKVLTHMIHGPCGKVNSNSPCMSNNECTKKFPKPLIETTNPNVDGYPVYRRRRSNNSYFVKNIKIDNSWVVPYNPYLLLKYDCHINVEVCASIKSIKYLFMYVHKGHERAVLQFQHIDADGNYNHDEIKQFVDSRYISAPQAMWHPNAYHMHGRSHAVIRLKLYLPNEQPIFLNDDNDNLDVVNLPESKSDTLEAWF